MHTLPIMNKDIYQMLCCPLCKGSLHQDNGIVCQSCGSRFNVVEKAPGNKVCDFRIHRPLYVIPESQRIWQGIQTHYEEYDKTWMKHDDLKMYLDEIDSVKEIYTEHFHLAGNVLDVGGHQGRLRHFLLEKDVTIYVCVDPFIEIEQFSRQPNLIKAYPCLYSPMNFLSCHAENLPFMSHSFDWVHMRSVLDHFADPYIALREAYRVLKSDGKILIGLSIKGKSSSVPNKNVVGKLFRAITGGKLFPTIKEKVRNIKCTYIYKQDDHNFQPSYEELTDLISSTGFKIEKEHWQKPPFTNVIYISATKA